MMDDVVRASHRQELRRGTVAVACLAILSSPRYGYALLESLASAGISVDANTLYPLLRRLERQGLLQAEWDTGESRPRKFYRTSPDGARLLDELLDEWHALHTSITVLRNGRESPAAVEPIKGETALMDESTEDHHGNTD